MYNNLLLVEDICFLLGLTQFPENELSKPDNFLIFCKLILIFFIKNNCSFNWCIVFQTRGNRWRNLSQQNMYCYDRIKKKATRRASLKYVVSTTQNKHTSKEFQTLRFTEILRNAVLLIRWKWRGAVSEVWRIGHKRPDLTPRHNEAQFSR